MTSDAEKALAHLGERQQLNSENYDKFLISLSSAGMALVVSYGKDAGFLQYTVWLYVVSVMFFALTVVIVLTSFLISNQAIGHHIEYWIAVKVSNDHSQREVAFNREVKSNKLINFCSILSYFTFIIAIVSVSFLACFNLKEPKIMSEEKLVSSISTRAQLLPPQAAIPTAQPTTQSTQGNSTSVMQAPKVEPSPASDQGEN